MGTGNRKKSEADFHNEYFSGDIGLRHKQSPYYPKKIQEIEHRIMLAKLGNLTSKKVLLYGAGQHFSLVRSLVECGASVVVTDISFVALKLLKKKIDEIPELSGVCTVLLADCEKQPFTDGSFDVCFGRSILHHLELEDSLRGMEKLLKRDGKIIFLEPLGGNPLIAFYRKITPEARTPFEHPFSMRDLENFKRFFSNVSFDFFYAATLLSFFFCRIVPNEYLFSLTFSLLSKVDRFLIRVLPMYHFLCWDVIVYGEKNE